MKRSSDGSKKSSNEKPLKDLFGRPIKSDGSWSSKGGDDLLIFTHDECKPKQKVACFDMDGTLITTKSGKVFAVDTNDWKLLHAHIPKTLRELHNDGFKIVIFTNQKGIKVGKVDKNLFKKKIEAIIAKLGVPVQAFVAISDGIYRKPCIGMWKELEELNEGISIEKSASLYVGDAAGRHKTSIRPKKDHSCADRFFALNVGLKFYTPEEFFEKNQQQEPWGPPAFEPKNLFDESLNEYVPNDTKIPSDNLEIIVLVGFPGSGKSSFSRSLAEAHGYVVINRDTLGTWQKCVAQTKYALNEGKRVIVDNTNPDKESRKRYIDVAKELGVECRCFKMNCDLVQAEHNVRYRSLINEDAPKIGIMVLRMHNSKFQEPDLAEGFKEIVLVNFKPKFDSKENKELFSMYLIE
ncbi:unnamed protein product [Caenorhabditis bovis]|uniref:PNK FHA domain-containing protein n=1 Tax=Caenorhabditis bovis TaxID=2654633 RepID=A0A8S1F1X8_9PELO|nr:unnamed protein product [Caenorhabditis bovis]